MIHLLEQNFLIALVLQISCRYCNQGKTQIIRFYIRDFLLLFTCSIAVLGSALNFQLFCLTWRIHKYFKYLSLIWIGVSTQTRPSLQDHQSLLHLGHSSNTTPAPALGAAWAEYHISTWEAGCCSCRLQALAEVTAGKRLFPCLASATGWEKEALI